MILSRRDKKNTAFLIASLLVFLSLYGCGKVGSGDEKKAAAYVNNKPIFTSELKREIALRAKQDPMFKVTSDTKTEQLDAIINRKLIIQEAMAMGLAREDRFVNTIKTFWEQTLIRDFIDYKKKEFQDYLFVTNEDVRDYYDNLSKKATFKVLKSRDKKYINSVYDNVIKGKEIDTSGWETVGPVGYEDVASAALLGMFGAAQGGAKVFSDASTSYLAVVAAIDKIEVEPLENLRPEIEKRILIIKERQLFEDWLRDKRNKSKIRIIQR